MAGVRVFQSAFDAGILGPEIAEREDAEIYYRGARDLLNMDPRPQGGVALRPGLAFYGRLRNVLTDIVLDDAVITAGGQATIGGLGDGGAPPPPDPPDYPDPVLPPDWEVNIELSEGGGGVKGGGEIP